MTPKPVGSLASSMPSRSGPSFTMSASQVCILSLSESVAVPRVMPRFFCSCFACSWNFGFLPMPW